MFLTLKRFNIITSFKSNFTQSTHLMTLNNNSLNSYQSNRLFSSPITSSHQIVSASYKTKTFDPWKLNHDIDYRDLKPISEMPSDNVLILDVREESEVIEGNIPSSVNIPFSKFEKLLDLHSDDFRKLLGFNKPNPYQKIILYCRSGARSSTALQIAKLKGFKNLRNYKGSWLDWLEKESTS